MQYTKSKTIKLISDLQLQMTGFERLFIGLGESLFWIELYEQYYIEFENLKVTPQFTL